MSLQEKMNQYKQAFEAKAPAEALAIMHRATRDLTESGILDRTIKVGVEAPDFTLKNTRAQEVSLGDLTHRGPLVLSFFRGRW